MDIVDDVVEDKDEGLPLRHRVDPDGDDDVQDGLAIAAEGYALVLRRQEARAPQGGAAAQSAAALEHDKGRQVVGLGADSVAEPGAHAGAAGDAAAAVHEELRRGVVEEIRVDGLDDGDVVDDLCEVGEPVGELGA